MASSFKGLNLFGSGPHRFARSRQGHLLIPDLAFGGYTPKTHAMGVLELEFVVRGRLVASSSSGLWALRDAITDQITDPPSKGALIDLSGRSYEGMSFVRYDEGPRVDRGRAHSIAYVARFRRLLE